MKEGLKRVFASVLVLCIILTFVFTGCVTRKESDGKDVNDTTKKQTEDATSQAKPEEPYEFKSNNY
jgi:PBP1b-binding outer membrane lipoprotein LpoB